MTSMRELNFWNLCDRLEKDNDTEEVENDPVLRNYLIAMQSDYGQMLNDTVRSFVRKERLLTDVDICGIKDPRPRERMENANTFGWLFQENYKYDNKNLKGRVFDASLGRINSRLNRIKRGRESGWFTVSRIQKKSWGRK